MNVRLTSLASSGLVFGKLSLLPSELRMGPTGGRSDADLQCPPGGRSDEDFFDILPQKLSTSVFFCDDIVIIDLQTAELLADFLQKDKPNF
jgi:hypothetical protein